MAIIIGKQTYLNKQTVKFLLSGFLIYMSGFMFTHIYAGLISILIWIVGCLLIMSSYKYFMGALGERRVTKIIKEFPDYYTLFNNVTINRRQIDHILVCPKGVFAIETKAWFKNIYGREESSKVYQKYGHKKIYRKNPALQAKRNADAVTKNTPDLIDWVNPLVVLAGVGYPKIYLERKIVHYLYYTKLFSYFKNHKSEIPVEELDRYVSAIKKLI